MAETAQTALAFDEGTGTTTVNYGTIGGTVTVASGDWETGHTGGATSGVCGPTSLTSAPATVASFLWWMKKIDIHHNFDDLNYIAGPNANPDSGLRGLAYYQDGTHDTYGLVGSFADEPVINSGITLTDTTWHHYGITFNGTTTYLYVDGILAGSVAGGELWDTTDSYILATNSPFSGGGSPDRHPPVMIDDFRVFNTFLSGGDVATWMSVPVSGGGGGDEPSIHVGSTEISTIKVGSTTASKVYVGSTLIWPV